MKNFKFRTLLMGFLLLHCSNSMLSSFNCEVQPGVLNKVIIENIIIFTSPLKSNNLSEIFKENFHKDTIKNTIILINASNEELGIIYNNTTKYFHEFNKNNLNKEKKEIKIFNLLDNNNIQKYLLNNKKDKLIENINFDNLIKMDVNIFKECIQNKIKEIFEKNNGLSTEISQNITMLLIDLFIEDHSKTLVKNVYNLTIYNNKLSKKNLDTVEIFKCSEDSYFLQDKTLTKNKPTTGSYKPFNHNLELHISYKHNE